MAVGGCSRSLVTIGVVVTMGALGCGVMTNFLNDWYKFDAKVNGVDVAVSLGLWKVCFSASADGASLAECKSIPSDSTYDLLRGLNISSVLLGLGTAIFGLVGCCSRCSQVTSVFLGILQGGAMAGALGKYVQELDSSKAAFEILSTGSPGYGLAFYLCCASTGLALVAVLFHGFACCAAQQDPPAEYTTPLLR